MMTSVKCTSEDPHWLFCQFEQFNNLLLIDCRPLDAYVKAHIEGAINITISSLMLRRCKKGNISISTFINSVAGKERFDRRSSCDYIVIYDENSDSTTYRENSIMELLESRLSEENIKVVILNGGFQRFEESFPHLCQCGEGTELDKATFTLSKLAVSDIIIPSPNLDSNNNIATKSHSKNDKKKEIHNSKDLLFRPDSSGPIEIIPHLYLGNRTDSSVLNLLEKANITHILNVTHDLPNVYEDTPGYEYLQLPVQDNWDGNMLELFPKAYSFIDNALEAGGNVLVHCLGGISRSSTIIIAYLMIKNKYNLNDAYDFVRSKKSNIAPNFNFMGQLLDFERSRSEPHTPFPSSTGSISPGIFSDGSSLSTSSMESNGVC